MHDEDLKEKKIDLFTTSESTDNADHSTPDSLQDISDTAQDLSELPSFGDRYQPLAKIGHGGMGVVYKARDSVTGGIVAIKVLKKELTADKTALKRFEQEVSSLSELDHANLVALYGQGQTLDGAPYLVMEYIEGKSLAAILEEEKPLEPKRAIDLILQITEGLAHAHEKGIVHRDLKPSNIIINQVADSIEVVRILDFGIARIVESTTGNTTNLTQTGDVFGTPNYMSPEQCEGKPIDSRSDIYSLGCMMFELLTGRLPFDGLNPIQVAVKHINDKPPGFSSEKKKKLKQPLKSLESITLFCLAKDKTERYQSIQELSSDLRRVKVGKKVTKLVARQRPKRLTYLCAAAIVTFIVTTLIFGSSGLSLVPDPSNVPEQSLPAKAFLVINVIGALIMLYCVFRDRAAFRSTNRTMDDFWSFLDSSLFAVSIWTTMLLYAMSLGCNIATGPVSWITSLLGVVALAAGTCALIVDLGLTAVMKFEKTVLFIPFARKTARKQGFILSAACAAICLLGCVLSPVEMAWLPCAGAASLSRIAPQVGSLLADVALLLHPQFGFGLETKAAIDRAIGKSDNDVLRPLNSAIVKDPENAELFAIRGKVNNALNNTPHAIADYTSAIKLEQRADWHKERAQIYVAGKQYQDALADYSEALTISPQDSFSYTARGLLYASLKNYKHAIEDLSTAIASSSSSWRGPEYVRRGLVYELAGDRVKAQQDFNLALKASCEKPVEVFVYKKLGLEAEYKKSMAEYSENNLPANYKKELSDLLFPGTVKLPVEL